MYHESRWWSSEPQSYNIWILEAKELYTVEEMTASLYFHAHPIVLVLDRRQGN